MSAQHHASFWEQVDTGALVVDGQRRIVESNPAAARLLGSRNGGLTGKTLLEATLSYEFVSLLNAAQETAQSQQQEIRRSSDAASRTLRVSISPLRDAEEDAYFLVLLDDVTELRRLEIVRRDFVANVSHELRTPLASIRAMAETLQDGAVHDDEVAERFVNIIVGEVERLTRILEDLLVLSRAESKLPERNVFPLNSLIQEVAERFQTQAEKAVVRVTTTLPETLMANANRDQIEQVLINLLDNAIKYTPSGGKVEIRAEATGDLLTVHLSDTGIGIMSQDLPRVFERFYRVDKARSRQSGGTGLGLSIVKHIVETHSGSVTVHSEYGRGTTFTFTLPRSS